MYVCREKTEDRISTPKSSEEKVRWEKFRDELKVIETQKLEKLRYYEKNPEKHPQYPEEWKSFWNRRYNELQRSGIDPSKHDFKPEWISFWTKRMKELYEEDLNHSKNDLRKKFDLPDDRDRDNQWKQKSRRRNNTSPGLIDISPPTPDKKDVMADIKSTWKALTGSDIKDAPKRPLSPWEDSPPSKRDFRSPSPDSHNEKLLEDMPQRKARTSSLIFVLRKLTVLEQQLGYLAPKVFDLMQQALAFEKVKEEASLDLLHDPDNAFYLETVREKLIGLLCAGVVPRNMVNTARSAIKHIDIALYLVSKREKVLPDRGLSMPSVRVNSTAQHFVEPPRSDPVVVPGVGQVDKVAIAQQIATALIEQGKTNVSEAELGQLINAVVGMAEASANSSQPMTTANFLQHLQSAQNSCEPAVPTASMPMAETVMPIYQPSTQTSTAMVKTQTLAPDQNESQPAFGGLKLLQSAYNDSSKAEQDSPKPNTVNSPKVSSHITDEKLAATLATFNNTSKEEQPVFIEKLKISNPELYNRLCPFIPINALISPNHSKRSPIVISLSKAKSEQKIKPISSERLSPFSSRSGGANPTVGEGVVIDVDEDENLSCDYSSKQKNVESEKGISSYKPNKIDFDDDDDDDYSFEDVYKAAQERLKQKQLDNDLINNQSGQDSAAVTENKQKETLSKTDHESIADQKHWDLESQKSNAQEDQQQHSLNREEENKKNVYSQYDQFREIPSRVTQFQSTDAPIQYQDTNQRRPERPPHYSVREEYLNDNTYSKLNAETYVYNKANPAEEYDKSRQYADAPYYSETAPYSHQSRDQYSYGDGYSNQSNTGYGNNPSTNLGYGNNPLDSGYNNQTNVGYGNNMYSGEPYRSRQQQSAYGNNDYGSWTHNRFPNSNYPPY